MERAAVFIGVKKTGGLPELQAVTSGVQQMVTWARSQGIPDNRIKTLTDESGEVRAYQISNAIEELVGLTTVEQLIVYFSGHGINKGGEYWLLSRAPGDANEAVNVDGSVQLARYCGIGHVILVSDACRTAAEGIQAQYVTGCNIFPNEPGDGRMHPVDVFYACARGKPSLEVRDPVTAAAQFSGLYTEILAECLNGQHAEVLDYEDQDGAKTGLVRPLKLQDYLCDSVSKRLRQKLGRIPTINQEPDALIVSRETWLSRISGLTRAALPPVRVSRSIPVNPFTVSEALVSHALESDSQGWQHALNIASSLPAISSLKDAVATYTTAFGPTRFETNCGFKLRGGSVVQTFCSEAKVEILDDNGSFIRVDNTANPGVAVLLELRNGTGVLIPAIPDFIAELTFEDDELANVSYEPSDTSKRWGEYVNRQDELRKLRASVAASVGLGVFRLNGDNALKLAQRIQLAEGIDPSMALYAAYAYHDLQQRDLIKTTQSYLERDLGWAFFDISLLSGGLSGSALGQDRVLPPFPMLSRGWSLLSAFRVELPGSLQQLQQHLLPTVWTMFDQSGVKILTDAINSGEIR